MKRFRLIFILSFFIFAGQACRRQSINDFRRFSINDYCLPSDSIDFTIAEAERVWNKSPWKGEYSKDDFIQYVLPPFAAKEPIQFYWRMDIPQKLGIEPTESILTTANEINGKINVVTKNEAWGNAQSSYSEIMAGKTGKCDDRTTVTVLALRAYGIPAAFDYIPSWGDTNNGHSFCSVILPSDSLLVYQNRQDNGSSPSFAHKISKIYRRCFFPQTNLLSKYRGSEYIPEEINDLYCKDVTRSHKVGCADVKLSINECNNKLAYLCVFSPKGWIPIAYGETANGKVNFHDIGNGAKYEFMKKGENIGDGILYLPVIYDGQTQTPIGKPFILSRKGVNPITYINKTETVTLGRKYPRLERIIRFAELMRDGRFEAANKADFSDATCLYQIDSCPQSNFQIKKINELSKHKFKYARYIKSNGTFSLSELAFYDCRGHKIEGVPFVPEYIESSELSVIYDKNPLSYYEIGGIMDFWGGVEFDQPAEIGFVGFCPRTDANDIEIGDEYELLYWDDQWKSLGKKKAETNTIIFDDVPQNALLWLRDLTKGREERPFTYSEGRQIWW